MNENEEREPYVKPVKPELAKMDNIKDLTAYDGGCNISCTGGFD